MRTWVVALNRVMGEDTEGAREPTLGKSGTFFYICIFLVLK